MVFQLKFDIDSKIYLKNPESSDLGILMVKKAIDLIYELGFKNFTFKKLAIEINSTEATIYRYFENKYCLLLYILNWYWCYIAFLVTIKLDSITDKKERLKIIIYLLTHKLDRSEGPFDYDKQYLNQIVVAESSMVYLINEVNEMNKGDFFKPYKDLCGLIAEIIAAYNPKYKYPKSLSSTIMEISHQQQFFASNLPRLTDATKKNPEFTCQFIEDFVFKIIG